MSTVKKLSLTQHARILAAERKIPLSLAQNLVFAAHNRMLRPQSPQQLRAASEPEPEPVVRTAEVARLVAARHGVTLATAQNLVMRTIRRTSAPVRAAVTQALSAPPAARVQALVEVYRRAGMSSNEASARAIQTMKASR